MKVDLAPFQIKRKDGLIWVTNALTGTQGPKLEETKFTIKYARRLRNRLNSEFGLSACGV